LTIQRNHKGNYRFTLLLRSNELNRHPQDIPLTAADYPFFPAASSKADHILGIKAIFNKKKNKTKN
jgi:hypothetical protein